MFVCWNVCLAETRKLMQLVRISKFSNSISRTVVTVQTWRTISLNRL